MALNPGDVISIIQVAYKTACFAVDTAYTAINFVEDSEALVVQLEIARYRLHTWGANAGLAEGTLSPKLLIIYEIVRRQLDVITNIFYDVEKLCDRYLMLEMHRTTPAEESASTVTTAASAKKEEAMRSLLKSMRRSLRRSGMAMHKTMAGEEEEEEVDNRIRRVDPGVLKRLRWGIRDKDLFSKYVAELHRYVDILHKLLSETSQQRAQQDDERVKIVVVGSAVDSKSLDLIKAAVGANNDIDAHAMAERKALTEEADAQGSELAARQARKTSTTRISLASLDLPSDYGNKQRLLAWWGTNPPRLVMLEKKAYDPDIDPVKKNILFRRVQRLTMLLSGTRTPSMKTPKAVDYITDNTNFCWWLVMEFSGESPQSTPLQEPLTLHKLLQPGMKFKPPLEQRFQLAASICGTMSALYSSGWLHKSLRSANVLLPFVTLPSTAVESGVVCQALVSGFEYSRQETDLESINHAMMFSDIGAAIYRHPLYQGEAAQGYRIEYDIYSLGLVLVEIALWVPLASFLDGITATGQRRFPTKIECFHRPEAMILKTMVLDRLKKEFAFRFGTVYYEAVKWCLTRADLPLADLDEDPVHPALEFYNNVLIPLEGIKLAA